MRSVQVGDNSVVLELDDPRHVALLDRALTCFMKSLVAARDLGIITHEQFCAESNDVRQVQFAAWRLRDMLEAAARHQKPENGGQSM